jgi:hypothetical protein
MRFTIETFFSDQKSRGFNIDKSDLSSPQRLTRLMYASCLAYLWIIFFWYLGIGDRFVQTNPSNGSLRSEFVPAWSQVVKLPGCAWVTDSVAEKY